MKGTRHQAIRDNNVICLQPSHGDGKTFENDRESLYRAARNHLCRSIYKAIIYDKSHQFGWETQARVRNLSAGIHLLRIRIKNCLDQHSLGKLIEATILVIALHLGHIMPRRHRSDLKTQRQVHYVRQNINFGSRP